MPFVSTRNGSNTTRTITTPKVNNDSYPIDNQKFM